MIEKLKAMFPDMLLGMIVAVLDIVLNQGQGYPASHLLCDGFFVAAVMLLGTGGIRFCQSKGALDGLGYGASYLMNTFLHAGRQDAREEDYFSYCQRKAEERKPYGNTILAGCFYMVLALMCLVIYQLTPVSG